MTEGQVESRAKLLLLSIRHRSQPDLFVERTRATTEPGYGRLRLG